MQRFTVNRTIVAACAILIAHAVSTIFAQTASTSKPPAKPVNPVPEAFSRFVGEKRALTEAIAKNHDIRVPSLVRDFFAAAEKGEWAATSNLFYSIEAASGRRGNTGSQNQPAQLWGPVHDTFGIYELVKDWSPELLGRFGNGIVESIPPGSIYFGGTDPGRFAVSAFSQAHSEGRPFFTLTQNALADATYIEYLRDMYGARIYIPDTNDVRECFQEYLADAQSRLAHDRAFPDEARQIRPGEDVKLVGGGRVQVSGQVAVMAVNALIAKAIFDNNPACEFYYEESFPLHWMYPHLTPHQFVFKLNRDPVEELSPAIVGADREFWKRETDVWLGTWLTVDTPVRSVAEFAEKLDARRDFTGFEGDRGFVEDMSARKAFSKLRASIGGAYAWRAENSKDAVEKQRMKSEADFAFRQAFALCPVSPEAVFRYVKLLLADNRTADALRIAVVAHKLDGGNKQLADLVRRLREIESNNNR
jgi:hypothetical protein